MWQGDRLERLRVKRPEPLAVAAARRHQDHRAVPFAVGTPVDARHLRRDLVEGERQEIGELQEGDGTAAGQRAADGLADDRRLRQGRVLDARPEFGGESTGHAEDVAFRVLDVLPEQRDPRVPPADVDAARRRWRHPSPSIPDPRSGRGSSASFASANLVWPPRLAAEPAEPPGRSMPRPSPPRRLRDRDAPTRCPPRPPPRGTPEAWRSDRAARIR